MHPPRSRAPSRRRDCTPGQRTRDTSCAALLSLAGCSAVREEGPGRPVICARCGALPAAADAGVDAAGRVFVAAADAGRDAAGRVGEAAADAGAVAAGRVADAAADAGVGAAGRVELAAAD